MFGFWAKPVIDYVVSWGVILYSVGILIGQVVVKKVNWALLKHLTRIFWAHVQMGM